jgi:hypothetical protein
MGSLLKFQQHDRTCHTSVPPSRQVAVGWASTYGRKPTQVENLSDPIAFGGIIYLVAAAMAVAAMVVFARKGQRQQRR